MVDWGSIRHFKRQEFDSADEAGSGDRMDGPFLLQLNFLRGRCGFPFTIRSGYRTEQHNRFVGGSPNSAHLRGLAADIAVGSGPQRYRLVSQALQYGICRVGIGKDFVHLDCDESLPQEVIWLYPASQSFQ